MVSDKMATILFKTEHHWKTKQKATIGNYDEFGILAPTVYAFFHFDTATRLVNDFTICAVLF